MATISRSAFLSGLGGLAAGVPLGMVGARYLPPRIPEPADPDFPFTSFAQAGEDLAAHFTFGYLGISDVSYLDVGAYDPIRINNTYFFYLKGSRGVLVEPNVEMCKKLRAVRPGDTTLEAGIGITAMRWFSMRTRTITSAPSKMESSAADRCPAMRLPGTPS